jgi:hypothetical protein
MITKRPFIAAVLLIASICAANAFGVGRLGANFGHLGALGRAGKTGPLLSLDGTSGVQTISGATLLVPLTTANGSGVVIIGINVPQFDGATVTAPGLTFTQRTTQGAGGTQWYVFEAPYAANFSGNITVTSAGFVTALAFGISGAKTSAP